MKYTYTVNIYRYKTIEANANTGEIPTTSKFFSLYVPGIAEASMGNLPKNGNLAIGAKLISDID